MKDLKTSETKWLRPREIARQGLIRNSTGGDNEDSNYFFILNLLKTGKLKGKDVSSKSRKYWIVSEDAIREYLNTIDN